MAHTVGPCHRIHLNCSGYPSEDSFLKQCHTYCFQVPSSSSLALIWACAQKSVLYMFSLALAVTWGVLSTNKNNVKFSWKWGSCPVCPDEGSLVAVPHCRLHLSLWMFVISPRGLSFCLTSPSPHQPFGLWACVCLHFYFLVWHFVLCQNDFTAWLIQLVFQLTGFYSILAEEV